MPSSATPASKVPLAQPLFGPEEVDAVAEAVRSGQLSTGPRVKAFEDAFAAFTDAPHAVAVVNGTAALTAGLSALGVGPGDEVVVPGLTFIATANAVLSVGAKPVFADLLPDTRVLDPASVRRALTSTTKAVIAVHLYGHPAPMQELEELADSRGLVLVGDAAQAHGARLGGRSVGSFGALETFSFYATKNMTTGEGGMVTTRDQELAARVRSYINHGRDSARGPAAANTGYDHPRFGLNFRMTELPAALGLVQLRKLEAWNETRRSNAAFLTKAFEGLGLGTPKEASGARHVYHLYVVKTPRRAALMAALDTAGIGHGIHYPRVLAEYPHLRDFRRTPLPVAEQLAREALSLPVHPGLGPGELGRVADAVRAWAIEG